MIHDPMMRDPWDRHDLADFWPRDSLPWEEHADHFLQCRSEDGFTGLRRFVEVDRHVNWIADELGLTRGARVLDLGCGPGLYTNALAAQGLSVTGLDISCPLLRYAKAKAAGLKAPPRYVCASLLAPHLGFDPHEPQFDAVLLINSPLGLLNTDQVASLLSSIAARLGQGGQLLAEIPAYPAWMRQAAARNTESTIDQVVPRSPLHPTPHRWIQRLLAFPHDGERVTHHIVQPDDGPLREYWSRTRLFTPDHITTMLEHAGLVTRDVYGMHPGVPCRPQDETMFLWAYRPADREA